MNIKKFLKVLISFLLLIALVYWVAPFQSDAISVSSYQNGEFSEESEERDEAQEERDDELEEGFENLEELEDIEDD